MTRQKRALWLLLTAALATLDLWSKALWNYPTDFRDAPILQKVVFDSWLQIRTVWNLGGVWSLPVAADLLRWATWIAMPAVTLWIFLPDRVSHVDTAAKAMILGGAVGNLYDRERWGAVRDFIDVYFGGRDGWHWPTFNVADMSLVIGICLLLLMGLKKKKREAAE